MFGVSRPLQMQGTGRAMKALGFVGEVVTRSRDTTDSWCRHIALIASHRKPPNEELLAKSAD